MSQELALSHYSRQWLRQIATNAKLTPNRNGQRWLLHLTPDSPQARTITVQIRWSNPNWQLLSVTNAGDWPDMNQAVDEICFDSKRRSYWRCQAGPVSPLEQIQVLARFMADLQRSCTNHGFTVESGPLPHEERVD
ncbi:hypothetical protein [Aeromonas veronii]|uniref:hypothetical protein n=1 Tax=Aeromonas veronii TaxID=654 RepID=UPI0032EE97C1